jgi:hypothetical protein
LTRWEDALPSAPPTADPRSGRPPDRPPPRVAFYGRALGDPGGGAERAVAAQYRDCLQVLPAGAITAVFFDTSAARHARQRPQLASLAVGPLAVARHGGLGDLFAEAACQRRRFDYVIAVGPDRFSGDLRQAASLLRRLDEAGVGFLVPASDSAGGQPAASMLLLRTLGELLAAAWQRMAEDSQGR